MDKTARQQLSFRFEATHLNLYLLLFTTLLLLVRETVLRLDMASSHSVIAGIFSILLFFTIGRYRQKTAPLVFFALLPLFHGLQKIGFCPGLPIIDFGFTGLCLGWSSRSFHSHLPKPTSIEKLLGWLGLAVIISLLTTLLQYPLEISAAALLHPTTGGQVNDFWCLDAALIFLQGIVLFYIFCRENRDLKPEKLTRVYLWSLWVHLAIIVFFGFVQIACNLPPIHNSAHGVISPFDDVHSFGSVLVLYLFILTGHFFGIKKAVKKKKLLSGIFIITLIVLIYHTASTATWVVTTIGSFTWFFVKKPKIAAITMFLVTASLSYYNFHPELLDIISNQRIHRVAQRLLLTNPYNRSISTRLEFNDRAIGIIATYPLSGSGIGSFWRVSKSYHFFSPKPHELKIENAHNYYLQLAADIGLPALAVFLAILYLIFSRGIAYIRRPETPAREKNFATGLLTGLGAYLLTMLSGHPLLLPIQQFCFWSVAAMTACLVKVNGIATTSPQKSKAGSSGIWGGVFFILLITGAGYRLYKYPTSPQFGYGVYPAENWNGETVRWIGKHFAARLHAGSSLLSFVAHLHPPNIDPRKGLGIRISIDDRKIAGLRLFSAGSYPMYFPLPDITTEKIKLEITVDRTFNPRRLGLGSDPRNLGIALENFTFLRITPPWDLGFYAWETISPPPLPGFEDANQVYGRWSGQRALLILKTGEKRKRGLRLSFMCAHPDIEKKPVRINFFADNKHLQMVSCNDKNWHQLNLTAEKLKEHEVLSIDIDRTWNPKAEKISDDTRNLGILLVLDRGEK